MQSLDVSLQWEVVSEGGKREFEWSAISSVPEDLDL